MPRCARLLYPLCVIAGIFLASPVAWAQSDDQEVMGHFRFSELFLSPRLRLQEPGLGGFELEQSWLGFEWNRDRWVRGVLKLGSADLLRKSVWYTPERRDFSVVEAWMEARGDYGDIRAGLVTIPQGFEGANPEWNAIFPETWARRQGWTQQRDLGVQFRFETKPWTTYFSVHNGESGENQDRWLWASGLWQYKNSEGFGVLMTASAGNTRFESTQGATKPQLEGFVFDPNESAKIRYGILSVYREDRRNLFLLEAGRGEIIQGDVKGPYQWGRADVSWNFTGDANLLFRYEQNQANLKSDATLRKISGLGLVLASKDNLQSVTFFGSRIEEDPAVLNDEFWLIFRLHSNLL